MMSDVNSQNPNRSRPVWSLPGVVFVVASLVLLAGFLIPLPEKALDILWVCSFILAGAVTFICMVTKNSSDLVGFTPMLSSLMLLSLIVQTGTARRIIQDESAGVLLDSTGSALASIWPVGAVLICLTMAVIIVVVVFAACQKITLATGCYFEQVLPLKHAGIENDLRLGVIDEEQADKMSDRVVSESRFFSGMKGAAMLMRAETAVCIFILLACLAIPVMNDSVNRPAGGLASLTEIAPPVVALSIFSLIPALIVAAACGAMMSKDTLALRSGTQDKPAWQEKKAKFISLDADTTQETQLPDTNLTNLAAALAQEPQEQIVEFEPPIDDSWPILAAISCQDPKEYYEKLAELIYAVDMRPRVVLLASEQVHCLPVTVAVNAAILLAQQNKKILLIDTDIQRHAVAHVFDLDPQSLQKKIKPSCLENLSVGCVPWEKLFAFLQKQEILSRFDTTLIYTPALPTVIEDPDGLSTGPAAFYFIDDGGSNAEQGCVEKLAFCSWLRRIPSLQSALHGKS